MIILKPIWVGEIPRLPKAPQKTEVRYYQSGQTKLAQTIRARLALKESKMSVFTKPSQQSLVIYKDSWEVLSLRMR